MDKRKKKKAAVGETALPKGVPFDRQRERPLKWGIAIFKGALLVAPIAVGAVCAVASANAWPLVIGILVGFVLFANTYVVLEWEAAVVLRLGRLERIQGPGLFFTVPFIEFVASYVDQRLNATTFNAERALTADCVPVDVDAVLFWMVWGPQERLHRGEELLRCCFLGRSDDLARCDRQHRYRRVEHTTQGSRRGDQSRARAEDRNVGSDGGVGGDPRHCHPD